MLTLYDAPRCPFCARARIVLAEKGVDYETVVVELDERPDWIVELNPPEGRVPVLEQPGRPLLPESRVIMRYIDERFPDLPLLPSGLEARALVELAFERFDERLSRPYYRAKNGRGEPGELDAALAALDADLDGGDFLAGPSYTLADIAYAPWIIRAELMLGAPVRRYPGLAAWIDRLQQRAAIQAEIAVVGSLVA